MKDGVSVVLMVLRLVALMVELKVVYWVVMRVAGMVDKTAER